MLGGSGSGSSRRYRCAARSLINNRGNVRPVTLAALMIVQASLRLRRQPARPSRLRATVVASYPHDRTRSQGCGKSTGFCTRHRPERPFVDSESVWTQGRSCSSATSPRNTSVRASPCGSRPWSAHLAVRLALSPTGTRLPLRTFKCGAGRGLTGRRRLVMGGGRRCGFTTALLPGGGAAVKRREAVARAQRLSRWARNSRPSGRPTALPESIATGATSGSIGRASLPREHGAPGLNGIAKRARCLFVMGCGQASEIDCGGIVQSHITLGRRLV